MGRLVILYLVFLIPLVALGQENELPSDLRAHNLTQYHASLVDPTRSLNQDMQPSLGIWTRWQWQSLDSDPTTLFLNYSQNVGMLTSAGIGFFQNNTGVFLNTGVVLNAAHSVSLGQSSDLVFATNLFGFNQELADENVNFQNADSLVVARENAFLMRFSPAVRLESGGFSAGIVLDNLIGLDFSEAIGDDTPLVFTGLVSNDFPVFLFDEVSHFKPQAYVRAVENADTQVGLIGLFKHPKFWVQSGYNSFYGFSGGVGVTLLEKLALGALFETGLRAPANEEDATVELVISYGFGGGKFSKNEMVDEAGEEIIPISEAPPEFEDDLQENEPLKEERAVVQARQDSINEAKKAALLEKERAWANARRDSINKLRLDSINAVKTVEQAKAIQAAQLEKERVLAEARRDSINELRLDSINAVKIAEQAKAIQAAQLEKERVLAEARRDSINKVQQDSINAIKAKEALEAKKAAQLEKARQDSIERVRESTVKAEALERKERELALSRAKKDSINRIKEATTDEVQVTAKAGDSTQQKEEEIELKPGEKYEEVQTEDGLAPGFYLIANVFGTKKYFENFMKTLQAKGLEPKSFYRSLNSYNYVYLERYDSINEARKARDSKFGGRYTDRLWIFRVKEE